MFNACEFCNAKCCKDILITITIFDALRIEDGIKKPIESFVDVVFPSLLFYNEEDLISYYINNVETSGLLALKSKPCIFLKNNRCSIYEYRPLACRIYPYNLQGKLNKNALCPLTSKFLFKINSIDKNIIALYKKEENIHRAIVKRWNKINKKIRGDKKKALEFLKKEAKKQLSFL